MGTNRNYRRTPRRPTRVRAATGDIFLILVEGEATEIGYFGELRLRLARKAAAVVVWHGDHTDPVGMVREALRLRAERAERAKKGSTEPYNQTWVVVDGERQNDPRRKQLVAAIQLAEAEAIHVALSIPSFEFWLLLHYEFTTRPFDGCSAVAKALKKHIKNYKKTEVPVADLFQRVGVAIKNAARCHAHWKVAGGDRNPSTAVDKLVCELNDSARSDVRLF
jgi:hypothetical protein